MSDPRGRREKWRRRAISVPGLAVATIVSTLLIPVWLPVALLVDAVRMRFRFPLARLMAFGVCWCWIESSGVLRAFALWLAGRVDDRDAHYALMARWSTSLMTAMRRTTGLTPRIEGLEQLTPGNAIVLSRHASLGDSLLSGWALTEEAQLRPRYVLKKELLYDPCLDVVGLRVPNHFLDRGAGDGGEELDALRSLATGIGDGDVAVIFAEGTRSNDRKRARALDKIADRDPERAQRMRPLRHLLPPRPAGSMALLDGAPDADVVLVWHTGFDGLDTFAGMIDRLARPLPPSRFVARRVARADVPDGPAFVDWLDRQWLDLDEEVAAALDP